MIELRQVAHPLWQGDDFLRAGNGQEEACGDKSLRKKAVIGVFDLQHPSAVIDDGVQIHFTVELPQRLRGRILDQMPQYVSLQVLLAGSRWTLLTP